jgi:signal transduction histidine kinase
MSAHRDPELEAAGLEMRRISHELNNSLSVILNGAQFALDDLNEKPPDLAEVRVSLRDVLTAGGQVRELSKTLAEQGKKYAEP